MAAPSRARAVVALAAVLAVTVAVRAIPAAGTPNLYGFDPYVHYYYAGFALEHGTAAPFAGFENGIEDDRAFWPGLHLLTAAASSVTGAGLLGVFRALPPALGALTVMLLFLLGRRLFGDGPAILAAALYAVADHAAFQQSWLVQETVGMPLWVAFLFVALAMRPWADRRAAALVALLYMATLATHHLSHAVLVASFATVALVAPHALARRRTTLMLATMLPLTVTWWAGVGGSTGSIPDITRHMVDLATSAAGFIALAILALGAIALLLAIRRGSSPQAWAWGKAERLSARLGQSRYVLALVGLAVALLTALGLLEVSTSLSPVEGIGPSQVTKYALASFGAVGAVALLAKRDGAARPLLAMVILFAVAFVAVLTVLTFLPLQLRLFNFAYIPIALLAGVGAWRMTVPSAAGPRGRSVAWPSVASAGTVALVAVLLLAMVADDQARMTSDLSERYYHSDAELEAARWVRENTEAEATICAPFGVQPVVMAFGERKTDVVVVRLAMDGGDWTSTVRPLRQFVRKDPTYVMFTTDATKYGETENEEHTLEEIFHVGGSFLRTPSLFEFKYLNDEVLILRVSTNITGV